MSDPHYQQYPANSAHMQRGGPQQGVPPGGRMPNQNPSQSQAMHPGAPQQMNPNMANAQMRGNGPISHPQGQPIPGQGSQPNMPMGQGQNQATMPQSYQRGPQMVQQPYSGQMGQPMTGGNIPPNQLSQQQRGAPSAQMLQQIHNNNNYKIEIQKRQNLIKEETIPESLEDAYSTKKHFIFRGLFNNQKLGGKRENKAKTEPVLEATHQDFLMTEMTDMAIDFDEEKQHKRILMIRISREAQRKVKAKADAQNKKEEAKVEPQVLNDDEEEGFKITNQQQPIESIPAPATTQIRLNVNSLLQEQPLEERNEASNFLNMSNEHSLDDNRENNNIFNQFSLGGLGEQIDEEMEEEKNDGIPGLDEEEAFQINTMVQQEEPKFELEKQRVDIEPEIDRLPYPTQLKENYYDEFELFYQRANHEELKDEIPFRERVYEETKNFVTQKFRKYEGEIISMHEKKWQERLKQKKHEELMAQRVPSQIERTYPPQSYVAINVDSVLNTGTQPSTNFTRTNSVRGNPPSQQQIERRIQDVNIDFDMERPKIKIYLPHNIIAECFYPQDFQGLVPKEYEYETQSDNEDSDDSDDRAQLKKKLKYIENQKKDQKIYRPQTEDPLSQDDYEYLDLFPEPNDPKYMEPHLNYLFEQKRAANAQNDALLNREKFIQRVHQKHIVATNVNPVGHIDPEIQKQPQIQDQRKMWNQFEICFIKWYAELFGDQWRLITDILNYHPLTRGKLRDVKEVEEFYYNFAEQNTLTMKKQIRLSQTRDSMLPMMINQRPPSLFNCIQQNCYSHKNSIEFVHQLRQKMKTVKKLQIKLDQNQQILISLDQEQNYPVSPCIGGESHQEESFEGSMNQLPKKRGRPRKPKKDDEEEIKQGLQQEADTFMKDYIEKTEQEVHLRSNETKNYYQLADKVYQPTLKRRRIQENEEEEFKVNEEIYYQTPMICSLTKKTFEEGHWKIRYTKSIHQRFTPIFYLGYLYKKIHQQEKESFIQYENVGKLEMLESHLRIYLEKRIIKQANETYQIMKSRERNQRPHFSGRQEKLQIDRQQNLKDSIKNYVVEEPNVAGVESIGMLWNDNAQSTSIFHFDAKKVNQVNDDEGGGDRAHDFLKQTWEQKWEQMDAYWFQQHKHISPKEKKQELTQKQIQDFYQTQQEFNNLTGSVAQMQGGTPGRNLPSLPISIPQNGQPSHQGPNQQMRQGQPIAQGQIAIDRMQPQSIGSGRALSHVPRE